MLIFVIFVYHSLHKISVLCVVLTPNTSLVNPTIAETWKDFKIIYSTYNVLYLFLYVVRMCSRQSEIECNFEINTR